MKTVFILLMAIMGLGITIIPVQAQTSGEFGYQLHPDKLLENTEGTLQVFVVSNDIMVPKQIGDLKAVSSDNSIIQILSIEDGNDTYSKNVLVKAKKPGITTIALAAPGFASKEITLEVFNNNNQATKLLMKITPEEFPIDGPKYGYVGLQITTTGGLPTLATEDITIHLDTPNNDIIKLKNSEILIESGKYYAITEFEIIGSGDATIFAEAEGMNKISKNVKILEAIKPLELRLYTFPENYNSYSGTTGYAIVQLLDGDGNPVLADKDISLEVGVENLDVSINTSNDFDEIIFENKQLKIEKGSYSTYTKFTPRPNLGDFTDEFEQDLELFISTEGYVTTGSSITILHDEIGALEGEGPSITRTVPFLTSGKQEILGVTYYETDIEVARKVPGASGEDDTRELVTVTVPVQAKNDHKIKITSSELDTVNPIYPTMKAGTNAAIIFGNTGPVVSENTVNFYITDNQGVKTVNGEPIGPLEDDISLIIEPLLPMVLAEHQFPVLGYLEEGTDEEDEEVSTTTDDEEEEADPRLGVTPFIKDTTLTFSANEFIETEHPTIKQNQAYVLTNMMSKDTGTTTLSFQGGGFEGSTQIITHTTDPSAIHVSLPATILANSKSLVTMQLLDSSGNPVYAKKDVHMKLVSNNEQVLKTPDELTIKQGEYFTTFEAETIEEGEVELAILSEDFSLTRYDISVLDISPVLKLELLGTKNWNERIEAKLSVTIPQITTSLNGFNIEWETDGGEVVQFDEATNSNGVAILNIIANDKDTVKITAKVSGNGLSSATITETATILNLPVVETVDEQTTESAMLLDTNTMILIVIPIAIGAGLFYLKRTDRLDMLTEKLPIGDKIEEIKEKISDIRNR